MNFFFALIFTVAIPAASAGSKVKLANEVFEDIATLIREDPHYDHIGELKVRMTQLDLLGYFYKHRAQVRSRGFGAEKIEKNKVIVSKRYTRQTSFYDILGVLCHEVGHIAAATFVKSEFEYTETGWYYGIEGEADDWAGRECIPQFISRFSEKYAGELSLLDHHENYPDAEIICSRADRTSAWDQKTCVRSSLVSLIGARELYHPEKNEIPKNVQAIKAKDPSQRTDDEISYVRVYDGFTGPSLLSEDPTEVKATITSHPRIQCRLDTLVRGILGQSKPRCWFKEAEPS